MENMVYFLCIFTQLCLEGTPVIDRLERRLTMWQDKWHCLEPRQRNRRVFRIYAVCATLLFFLCFSVLILCGRSNIWRVDGINQHYAFMVYTGNWLREAIQALFSGSVIPVYDFSIGFGAGIIPAVNYYGFGDPLLVLSVFFSPERTEILYYLLTFARYFLAGLGCLLYLRDLKIRSRYALIASLCYAFSLYMLYMGALRHSIFMNPIMHLPFILWGVEKAFRRESPAVFMLSILWSGLCGFYFLYVNSLLLLVYALVRHWMLEPEHPWKRLIPTASRIFLYYGIGVACACALLLPATLGYLDSSRAVVDSSSSVNLFRYSKNVYERLLPSLVTYNGQAVFPAMPVVCVFAMLFAFGKRGDRRLHSVRWFLALSLVFALVPLFGYVFNGLGYVSSRWQYAATLVLSVALARAFPYLTRLERRGKILICMSGGLIVCCCAVLIVLERLDGRERLNWLSLLFGIVVTLGSVLVMLFANGNRLRARLSGTRLARRAIPYTLICCLILGNIFALYTMVDVYFVSSNASIARGNAYKTVSNSPIAAVPEGTSSEFFRTDIPMAESPIQNDGAVLGKNGTDIYDSILSGSLAEGLLEMNLGSVFNLNRIAGLNGRAPLEALWSARYFATHADSTVAIPYGFSEVQRDDRFAVYENAYALPMGYTTENYITEADYQSLSPLGKQWALLQGATLPQEDARYNRIVPTQPAMSVPYTIASMDGVSWENGKVTVSKTMACIRLEFAGLPDSEAYLSMGNLAPTDDTIIGIVKMGWISDTAQDMIMFGSRYYNLNLGKTDILYNLGYAKDGLSFVEIYFLQQGVYTLDSIEIFCQPMADFAQYVEALRAEPLTGIAVEENRVTGTVNLTRDKILVLSIPYAAGWSATVDGKPAELFASGTMFTALRLEAGEHTVALCYRTPGLRLGIVLSAAGVVAFCAVLLLRRRRMRGCGQ